MAIKRIHVENFKSFKELDVQLGPLNVVIGANASGKSNFVEVFRFLRDIVTQGLGNAVSLQGDVEYLRNTKLSASERLIMEVTWDDDMGFQLVGKTKEDSFRLLRANTQEISYRFALSFSSRDFEIHEDTLLLKFDRLDTTDSHRKPATHFGPGSIRFTNNDGNISTQPNMPEGLDLHLDYMSVLYGEQKQSPPKTLLLETTLDRFGLSYVPVSRSFSNIAIYDFDPKLPKKAVPITGTRELAENGSNLALVLRHILEDKGKKRMFTNLIQDLLPFVEDFKVEKYADRSLILELQEAYSREIFLPASFMSDGTINLAAFIIALYFEERPLAILEEPERNIHPYLISRIMSMLNEVSARKQIIVTTHNAEFVKYASLDSLLLVARDREGFSTVTRPSRKEGVQAFLRSEIGIDELYLQNLLGV